MAGHQQTSQFSMTDVSTLYGQSSVEMVSEQNATRDSFVRGCRVVDRQLEYLPWDNPDNLISLATQVNAYKAGGVLLPFWGILGMPLNLLNCVVFYKLGLRERVNLLLFGLSCVDFVLTLSVFTLYVEYIYMLAVGKFTVDNTVLNMATNTGLTFIPFGAGFISGFISTLIACERCLCTTHPLKAKQILRTKTTAVILIVCVVVILGFQYIISAKYKIGCEYLPTLKMSLSVFYASEFYRDNKEFIDILNVMVFGLFLPPFFVLTTVLATGVTVVKLKGAAQWRQSKAAVPTDSREIAVTKMLIAVSILFIVCSIPNLVIKIVPLFLEGFRIGGRHQNFLLLWIVVVNIFNAVNSSANFFFYFKMGSRFRRTVKMMLGCVSETQVRGL